MFHPRGPSFFELVRQALSSTRGGYDLLASKFDFTPYRTPDELLDAMEPFVSDTAGNALDLCCGTGAGLQLLIRQPELRRIVGMDFSEPMLEQSEKKFAADKRVELILGDVLEWSFSEQFDIAICLGALGHFVGEDYRTLLQQIYSALKPGGKYVFVAASKPRFLSKTHLICTAFNSAMHVRNLLVKPPFIMYYHQLMFAGPELLGLLESIGFRVEVGKLPVPAELTDGIVYPDYRIVQATKPG